MHTKSASIKRNRVCFWRKGDMLIWDNRAAMHKAHFDYDPTEFRLLYRVLVRGEQPIAA